MLSKKHDYFCKIIKSETLAEVNKHLGLAGIDENLPYADYMAIKELGEDIMCEINRKFIEDIDKSDRYEIIYDYTDSQGDETRNIREMFTGSWPKLQEVIYNMKQNGCYNISATSIKG